MQPGSFAAGCICFDSCEDIRILFDSQSFGELNEEENACSLHTKQNQGVQTLHGGEKEVRRNKMRILFNLSELTIGSTPAEELEEEIVSLLKELYNDSADDDEAYLLDELNELVLGRDTPDQLVNEAMEWNDRLRKDLDIALAKMQVQKAKDGHWPVDDQTTYELKKAAMAIDDDFYSYAEYAVARPLTSEPRYLQVVVTAEELEHIKQHAEQFAIAEIYAK